MGKSKKGGSFVQQAAILAAAAIISRFIGFLYRLPLTNVLGNKGNGYYGNGYYLYTFFLIISSAGLPAAISRMVSTRVVVKQYRNAFQTFKVSLFVGGAIGLVCSLVMGFGADTFTRLIKTPESYYTMITLAPTIFIVAIMSSFRGYFQGMNNSVPTAISQLIEQIINAVFSVVLAHVFISKGLEYAAAGATAATGIGAVAGLITIYFIYNLAKPSILRKVKNDKNTEQYESNAELAKELFSISIPIIIGTAVFSITNIIDMTMVKNILINIGFEKDLADDLYGQLTGKYYVLTTLPVSISTAFATAALPSVASSFKIGDKVAVGKKINTAMRITMILSVPSAVGIGILGGPILELLFRSYPEGENLLKIGAVSIIFLALSQISTGMLQGIGKVKIPAIAAVCGAIIKVPLNYIFISIPEINVVGAVISTIFCYLVASCIDIYFLVKSTDIDLDFSSILFKPIISSCVMGIACYTFYHFTMFFTNNNTVSVFVSIFISVITFFLMLILIRGLKKEDLLTIPFGNKIVSFLESLNAI